MNRRTFLRATAAASATGVAGVDVASGVTGQVRPPRLARVKRVGAVPTLVVDGRPLLAPAFETYAPRARYFQQFANAGTEIFGFSTNAAACDYGHSMPTWTAEDTWDYAQLEQRAALVLDAKPAALLLPRVNLGTPRWWLDTHPEALERFDDGSTVPTGDNPTLPSNRGFPSLASTLWREAIGGALRRLIRFVQASRFGGHVIGWCLSGGHTEEWYHWACNTLQLAGYSDATETAFQEWLRRKYRHVHDLRQAWNSADVDFERARVPSREERLDPGDGVFRQPARQMNVIDFYLFWNELIPDTIEYFARAAREATGGRHVIGAFYGYLYEFGGDPEFGHNAVARLCRSPFLDFMAVTASYRSRESATGSDYQRSPAASLRLHGKLWYHDNDVVSYRAKNLMIERGFKDDAPWTRNLSLQLKLLGYTDTPEKSRWMYRRGLGFALSHGMLQAWFDLHDGYFNAPDLMAEIQSLNRLAAGTAAWDRSSIAEILVIADENSCAYAGPRSDLRRKALLEPQNRLTRLGAPCDHVLLDDLNRVSERHYKLVLFLNCYHISCAQRRLIQRKLRRDGRHLVWFGAPGRFGGAQHSLGSMQELTGFRFRSVPGGSPPVTVDDASASSAPLLPELGTVKLFRKDFDQWTAFWTPAPNLPAAAFRELARAAGVHLFSGSDDVLFANRSLLVIHAKNSGDRAVHFPVPTDVVDLINGNRWPNISQIDLEMQTGETRLLHWGKTAAR